MSYVIHPPRITNWAEIRKSYIEEPERPTFEEVSARFSIPVEKVRRASSDEGWPLLRLQRLERALTQTDTVRAILAVAEGDRLLRDRVRSVVIAGLEMLQQCLADVSSAKPAARLRTIQSVSFALLNACNALKAAGIAVPSAPKGRPGDDAEKYADAAWARGLMQQLNVAVTVNAGETCNKAASVEVPAAVVSS